MTLEEEGVTSLKFLQTIYRNPEVPLPVRMKAAAIAIEYELPRLAVTATINSGDLAVQSSRAIEKQNRMIETKPMIEGSANVSTGDTKSLNGKPTIIDRRYRKW